MPKRKMHGSGVVDDIKKFVVRNKLISRGLGLIPNPAGQVASAIANQLGVGKRRRVRRRRTTVGVLAPSVRRVRKRRVVQTGTGIFSDLGNGIGSVFGGLGHGVGSIAHGLFGGRRRTIRRKAIHM